MAHAGEEIAFGAGRVFSARSGFAELLFGFSAEDGSREHVGEGLEEEGVVARELSWVEGESGEDAERGFVV